MDVIDADGHIVEKESEIRAYLPEPHCKRSGSLLPSDGQDSLMGGRLGGLEDNDLPTRIRDMPHHDYESRTNQHNRDQLP